MVRLVSRLLLLAAIGAVVGYVIQRRRGEDVWDAEDPDGDWGLAQIDLERAPGGA